MKVIFGAQGSVLSVLKSVDDKLRQANVIDDSTYWISDSEYFFTQHKQLLDNNTCFYEWNYTLDQKQTLNIDDEALEDLKHKYKQYNLWNAIVADRRLYMGRLCKSRKDDQSVYSDSQLFNIIYNTLADIDAYVISNNIDAIITFVPATYGDYLLHYVASANGVKYLQLKPTKIKNYVTFSDTMESISNFIRSQYNQSIKLCESKRFDDTIIHYIKNAKSNPVNYEGTVATTKNPLFSEVLTIFKSFFSAIKGEFFPLNKIVARDCHVPPKLKSWFWSVFLKPFRIFFNEKIIGNHRFNKNSDGNYIFYPLHSEPEIALSIYGRNHQNQIDTVRRIAQSIPLGWTVVVKEHPRSVSYRSAEWYKSLLMIPNVRFAPTHDKAFYWLQNAKAVITVSGFVGFEAVLLEKPVIILGDASFKVLPSTMVRCVTDMEILYTELNALLKIYQYNEFAAKCYVDACISESVPVNLYSDLLKKQDRNSMQSEHAEEQLNNLANLLKEKLIR